MAQHKYEKKDLEKWPKEWFVGCPIDTKKNHINYKEPKNLENKNGKSN